MATPTQIKRRGRWSLVLGTFVATIALSAVAFAGDDVTPDGDAVDAAQSNPVNFGTVSPGAATTKTARFTLTCKTQQHIDTGETVALTYSAVKSTVPSGGALTATNGSVGPRPSGWPADGSTCSDPPQQISSGTLTTGNDSTVQVTAPNTPGSYTYVVWYDIGGVGSNDVGGDTVKITYTLTVAAPADTAPSVSSTAPSGGTTGVAVGSNLGVTFSEPVDVTGAWFTISCGTSGAHAASVSGGPTTFTLDPATNFAFSESCTVTVVATLVTDQDTNDPPNAMAGNHSFSFMTEANPDTDGDGVPNTTDNCPSTANPGQENNDGDPQGDACDPDDDNDGVTDTSDNCALTSNPSQADNDSDGQGDACDVDDDNDTVDDTADNCQFVSNSGQANNDGDALGDACDPDDDNDTVADEADNCQLVANTDQANNDLDTLGDACDPDDDNDTVNDGADNCQFVANPGQANNDSDAQGDACDPDDDNDTVADGGDNCQFVPNLAQANNDGDALGDACDNDDDNDSVSDGADNCPLTANADQADADVDGLGNVCDSNAFAPEVASAALDATGNEGDTLSTSGSFSDADPSASLTVTKQSGDGTVTQGAGGSWSWSLPTTDNGSGTVVVEVSDGEHTKTTDTFNWSAANLPPTVELSNSNTYGWPESATAERTFSYTASDPAGANDPLTLTIDCGSGGDYVTGSNSGSSFKCRFPDGPASPNVQVSANDGDGGSDSDSHGVTVTNVSPMISGFAIGKPSGAACQGATNSVTVSFGVSDPATESYDPITGTINWGDGSASQAIAGRTISQSHAYPAGTHVVSVSVVDGDGGSATAGGSSGGSLSLLYTTSGLLQPINTDKTSNFKLGSTLPVKIRITDCTGAPVGTLTPEVGLKKIGAGSGAANEAVPESVPDEGNDMRYSDGQYIYNLSSKRSTLLDPAGAPLPLGSYEVRVYHPAIAAAYGYFDIVK